MILIVQITRQSKSLIKFTSESIVSEIRYCFQFKEILNFKQSSCLLGRRFYLLADSKKYTVGRHAQSDLSIIDDTSVSRSHAIIYRSSSGVRVEDLESRYGVFVNDGIEKNKPIGKKTPFDLQVGYIVRFGRLENTYRLENIEVKVCTSTLPPDGTEKLRKQLKVIDGVLLNNWSTECTHLIMPSVSVKDPIDLVFFIIEISREFIILKKLKAPRDRFRKLMKIVL